ncbi:MAG: choice-of-anchor Q domain-containing protein, partial [Anaerolineales bacterium]
MQTKRFYSKFNWFVYPIIIALVMVAGVLLARPESSGRAASNGATIEVNSLDDNLKNDGSCTLREAVISANKDQPSGSKDGECVAGSGADTIEIPLIEGNGTYLLTRTDKGKEDSSSTGDLDILDGVTIRAVDPGIVILGEDGFTDRIFHVLGGNVTIEGLTIEGGNVREDGGGIFNAATLTLAQSTVISNTAALDGGGIYNTGTLTVTNSTLSGNTAVDAGGGLSNDGSAYLNNVTVANNNAASSAGLSGVSSSTLNISNSIVAFNDPGNCSPSAGITSQGYNLDNSNDCGFSSTGDINDEDPLLGPLQDNGGFTPTYALLTGSPAIDAGNPAAPGSGANACETTDQRGDPRPRALACDIGAFEVQDPVQVGPIFIVTVSADSDDGVCSFYNCSLREAINAANSRPNDESSPDEIHFSLPGDPPFTIELTSALPVITDPVVIDGTTQPGGQVTLDGSSAGTAVDGLLITAGNSTVQGLKIVNFDGNGITLETNGSNLIEGNTIANNGGSGIVVLQPSIDNTFTDNDIYGNAGLPIDLGGDGPTANDPGDADPGPNNFQNSPVLLKANPAGAGLAVDGLLN